MKAKAYIDHCSRAGALALLRDPGENASAFTLLDLASCTEAMILYDTLVGFWGTTYFMESKALEVAPMLKAQMENLGINILTETRGSLFYCVPEMSDRYWDNLEYFDLHGFHKRLEPYLTALINKLPQGAYGYDPVNHTPGVDATDLTYGAFHYVLHATLTGSMYFASSLRTPVVTLLRKHINKGVVNAMQEVLDLVTDAQRLRLEQLGEDFYGKQVFLNLPSFFRMALQKCNGRENFLESVLQIRNDRSVRSLRKWVSGLQNRLASGKLRDLEIAKSELTSIGKSMETPATSRTVQMLEFIPSGVVELKNAIKQKGKDWIKMAVDLVSQPHVILLRRLVESLQSLREDRNLIQNKLGIELNDRILAEMQWIESFAEKMDNENYKEC
ncbi:MAG: hypothetical protein ABR969_01065 [Sedimentisphaerales bacterium]|jgi:hypothetical protein